MPGKQEPEGFAECSGEVGDGGVGGDDEIEVGDERGGVGEVAIAGAAVEEGAVFGEGLADRWDLQGGLTLLQRDPLDSRDLKEGQEGLEAGGAFAVGAVTGVAGPIDADGG